jgi:hypothetical protein
VLDFNKKLRLLENYLMGWITALHRLTGRDTGCPTTI